MESVNGCEGGGAGVGDGSGYGVGTVYGFSWYDGASNCVLMVTLSCQC